MCVLLLTLSGGEVGRRWGMGGGGAGGGLRVCWGVLLPWMTGEGQRGGACVVLRTIRGGAKVCGVRVGFG